MLDKIPIYVSEDLPKYSTNNEYYIPNNKVFEYISHFYADYGVTETAVKNMIKFGFLRDSFKTFKNKKYVLNTHVNNIFSTNLVKLNANDFFKSLIFAISMLKKVENRNLRFGTFFDRIAKRNGTVLNYLERHMVGKLGETGTVNHINNILKQFGSNLEVENSFDTTQVESADIVFLRNKKNNVLVNAGKRIQIKCSSGLNGVVLKEDKYKLDGETFNVDYCAFSQLLNSPFSFIIDYLVKLANKFSNKTTDEEILFTVSKDIDKRLLDTTVKISGFVEKSKMKMIEKGQKLPPLGDVSSDSYYAYVADLERDYSILAKELVSVRT